MKKRFGIIIALLSILLSGLTGCANAAVQSEKTSSAPSDQTAASTAQGSGDIVVLFTSDVHCGVDQNFGYVGLKAAIDSMKKAGNPVLLVDNGDSIQGEPIGTMSKGESCIDLMNVLNYDVAIPEITNLIMEWIISSNLPSGRIFLISAATSTKKES